MNGNLQHEMHRKTLLKKQCHFQSLFIQNNLNNEILMAYFSQVIEMMWPRDIGKDRLKKKLIYFQVGYYKT